METKTREKRGLAAIFALCPRRHVLLLVSAGLIALHLALRRRHEWMAWLSEKAVRPLHRALGSLNDHVPFSVAELLIALAVIAALVYIIYQVIRLFRGGEKGRRLYRTLVTLVSAGLTVYALFCLLWGVYYYADDFATRSGFVNEPVSTEQLASVTRYFARGANRYGVLVARANAGDNVYVYGQIPGAAVNPEPFAKGQTFVAPPYTNATVEVSGVKYIDLNASKWTDVSAAKQDRKLISGADFIQFRDASNRLIKFYYDGTSWGLQPTYAKLASYKPYVEGGKALVPQGTAFWYCSSVGGAKVEWK